MVPIHLRAVGLGVFALALADCSCDRARTTQTEGDPQVIVDDNPAVPATYADAIELDFGSVLVGDRKARTIRILNRGRSDAMLTGLRRDPGSSDAFQVDFTPREIRVEQEVSVEFAFEPYEPGDAVSLVRILTDSSLTPEIAIRLTGRGITGVCTVEPAPAADFGNVGVGETFLMPVVVKNGTAIDWALFVKGVSGSDADAFPIQDLAVPADVQVPANGQVEVKIAFTPSTVGPHTAFLEMPAPKICKPSVLPLSGVGVDALLVATPRPVDFGFVNPGSKTQARVKIKNIGNADVRVTSMAISLNGAEFAIDPATITTPAIPAKGGEIDVAMTFTPSLLGPRSGELKLTTDSTSPLAAVFAVPLKGYGGGPDIDLSPTTLDFGTVPIGGPQARRLLVANAGTDAPGTDRDNLRLIDPNGTGCTQAQDCPSGACDTTLQRCVVAATLTPANPEFALVWPPGGYDPARGLSAGQFSDLVVNLTPATAGTKTATVTVVSNDPDEPAVTAKVTADAQVLPPCDYGLVPPQLVFGNVEPGRSLNLDFVVKNKSMASGQNCILYQVEFDRTTPPAFSFVGTPPKNKILPPGAMEQIQVKFAPVANGTYAGAVTVYTSSTIAPTGTVKLAASAQQGCLLIAPTDIDYGVVQVGCGSREKTFTVYNVCQTPVTVSGVTVQAGVSNEFKLTSLPPMPANIPTGDKFEFKAKYSPTDVGKDSASIAVQTTNLTQPYVVTMQGRGDTVAVQTDVYTQDAQPRVDMLLVVDDSCSMDDKQQALASNFDALIKFAVAQAIDYHIAVTTTDVDCSGTSECGRFVPLSGTSPRVLTQNTPNKETLFKQYVNVGTMGSGWEKSLDATYKALSAPLITGWNAGFLREEATLAIVVVSDAEDQSSNPVNFFYNFLINIKGFRRANMVSFSGVVPTTSSSGIGSCWYDTPSSGRHTTLISRTGGVSEDICTPDWNKSLQRLSQNAFGYRTRFFLTSQPDPNYSIDVKVDGVPYTAVGTRGDVRWTYNSAENAIDFDPLAVPEPGSVLSISYRVQCLPP